MVQNVYATPICVPQMIRGASGSGDGSVNTRRLNNALQDMLHNMNKFLAKLCSRILTVDSAGTSDSYVEEIVWKKLVSYPEKTSDNFYIYKMDG